MKVHNWLAGIAAVTISGALPASAQGPRSLFEASAAPVGSAPVTLGFQQIGPAAPTPSFSQPAPAPVKSETASVKPEAAPANPAEPPAKSEAMAAPVAAASLPPAEKAQPVIRREPARTRQFAARTDPAELPPPPGISTAEPITPPVSVPSPSAAPTAETKPMSRAERRRAAREAKLQAAAEAAAPAPAPAAPSNPFQALFGLGAAAPQTQEGPLASSPSAGRAQIDALVRHHARINNVPEALVHRVIVRESKYNPRAVGRGGAMGLMQIKTATARGVGYAGGPAGLLDAETNITYAVKYLAGAWRVSGGSHDRAVMHYARGYYYEAKRQGLAGPGRREPSIVTASVPAQTTPNLFSLFSETSR